MRLTAAILLASSLAACAVDGDDSTQGGNGKADGNGSCTVPQYGDGTCQIDLACDVPDIDCYKTFETDQAAEAWLSAIDPVALVSETDPRFVRGRALLDKAYDLFRSRVQLGTLADRRVSLVVIDGPANAFVLADPTTKQGGFVVVVYSGLLESTYSDDQVLSTLAHELTHLAKLHFLDEVIDKIRTFYLAPDGKEPIGEQQMQDPAVRDIAEQWRKASFLAGVDTYPELAEFPVEGDLGDLLADYAAYKLDATCTAAGTGYTTLRYDISKTRSSIDWSLALTRDLTDRIPTVLANLKTCAAKAPVSLRAYLTELGTEWTTYITAQLGPDDAAFLDMPAVDAMLALVQKRRAALTSLQDKLAKDTGRPWSAVRFYSYEEAADDSSVRILGSAHIDAAKAFEDKFLNMLGTSAAACSAAITTGSAPYGKNIADEHHGTCWRITHARQISAMTQTTSRTLDEAPLEDRMPHVPVQRPKRPGASPIY